jgi:hypothetical protein
VTTNLGTRGAYSSISVIDYAYTITNFQCILGLRFVQHKQQN